MVVRLGLILLPLFERRAADKKNPLAFGNVIALRQERQNRKSADEEETFHANSRGSIIYAGTENLQIQVAAIDPNRHGGSYNSS